MSGTVDARIGSWSPLVTAGTVTTFTFTAQTGEGAPVTLSTLAVHLGGSVIEADDLTGTTEFVAVISGDSSEVATVDVECPVGDSLPCRLVVDGVVQTVGTMKPMTSGTVLSSTAVQLRAGAVTYVLTLPGISGGSGGAVASVNSKTGVVVLDADDIDDATTAHKFATAAQLAAAASAVQRGDLATVATTGAYADLSGTPTLGTAAAADTGTDPGDVPVLDGSGLIADALIPDGITRDSELTAAISAAIDALLDGAPGALDTLAELAAAIGDDADFAGSVTTALAGRQPLNSNLTAIAALTTTTFGRSLLELASAAAARTALGVAIGSDVQAHSAVLDASTAAYTTAKDTLAGTALQPGDDADTLGSGAATDGWVLTADGAGGAEWEAAAAGGGLDARSIVIDPFFASANSGWDTVVATNSYIGGGAIGTAADGSWREWIVALSAGTWALDVMHPVATSYAIAVFALNGTTIATVDQYGVSAVDVRSTTTGIVVASSGVYTLRATVTGKNALSSGFNTRIQRLGLRRTA